MRPLSVLAVRYAPPLLAVAVAMALLTLCACNAPDAASPTPSLRPATPSATVAPSATPLPTALPSATPSATPTGTATPTQTLAPTQTLTPTATPIPHLVAIDAGHGGIDLGTRHFDANGHMDAHESEINLALALLVRDELLARGYQVYMTRDGDYRVNADEEDLIVDGQVTTADEVQARVDVLNASGAELVLSIHQNSYWSNGEPDQTVGGPSTFYCQDRPFADENRRFAYLVQHHIVEAVRGLGYDAHDRGTRDDLTILDPGKPGSHLILLGPVSERIVRASEMVGALNETLFLSNDREAALLTDPAAQRAMAIGYADAIDAYFAGDVSPDMGPEDD